jgi:hypothetical protein
MRSTSHLSSGNISIVNTAYPGGRLLWEDYKSVNLNQFVCLEKITTMTENDLEYLEENFTTFLPDGKEYELEPRGKERRLTLSNRIEYIEKTKQLHLGYLEKAFELMCRGFKDYLHPYKFYLNPPLELEQHICGMNYVEENNLGRHLSPQVDHALRGFQQQ